MRGQGNRWYAPQLKREERVRLEGQASALNADRKQRPSKNVRKEPPPPAGPKRYTLADLKELRAKGLVP
jgi:hypothetical protein